MKAMLKKATKGLPQTGLQGGAGVGVFYLHRMLSSKVAFLQAHPLAAPIGFVVLGHVLKGTKKLNTLGAALVGAGGYAGAQTYELAKAAAAATPPAAAPAQTSGFEDSDTGMVVQPSQFHEVGMLLQAHNIGGPLNETNSEASSYHEAYSL